MTPTEAREILSHAKSIDDWHKTEDEIKQRFNGQLPDWWRGEIYESQFFTGLRDSWDSGLRGDAKEKF